MEEAPYVGRWMRQDALYHGLTHESMEMEVAKFRGYNGNHGSAAESGHGRWRVAGMLLEGIPFRTAHNPFKRVSITIRRSRQRIDNFKHRHSKFISHMICNHTALLSDSLVYGP